MKLDACEDMKESSRGHAMNDSFRGPEACDEGLNQVRRRKKRRESMVFSSFFTIFPLFSMVFSNFSCKQAVPGVEPGTPGVMVALQAGLEL